MKGELENEPERPQEKGLKKLKSDEEGNNAPIRRVVFPLIAGFCRKRQSKGKKEAIIRGDHTERNWTKNNSKGKKTLLAV